MNSVTASGDSVTPCPVLVLGRSATVACLVERFGILAFVGYKILAFVGCCFFSQNVCAHMHANVHMLRTHAHTHTHAACDRKRGGRERVNKCVCFIPKHLFWSATQ